MSNDQLRLFLKTYGTATALNEIKVHVFPLEAWPINKGQFNLRQYPRLLILCIESPN